MGYSDTVNAFDGSVSSQFPDKNYFESSLLYVRSGSITKLGYISFARPFKPRSSIIKAELVLHSAGDYSNTSRTVTVKRQGKRAALYKNLTHRNKPNAHSDGVSVTKPGAISGGEPWVFDVTAHVQKWSDGAAFDGWEISTTHTGEIRFYSTDTTESWSHKLQPELRVWVADEPDAPEDLSPSGNRIVSEAKPVLRWSQLDINGNTNIVAAQVQVDNTASFAAPDFDSGEQPIDQPSMNLQLLSSPAFSGLPSNGDSRFWRVAVKDGAGLWSDWSRPVSVRYLPKGTLTLLSPSVGAPTISDPTPNIAWSLAGATQRAYRLELFRQHATTGWAWLDVWDSGKVTATTQSVTIPKGEITYDDRRYKVRLVVWDTLDRQTTPTAPAAYIVEREFYFDEDAATAPTKSITARHRTPWPFVDVRFTFTTVPDRAIVSRDGQILDDIEADDLVALRQSDGSYLWTDRAPVPGKPNMYTVRPFSGGKMGWGNPSATVTPDIKGRWLVTKTFTVFVAGKEQELALEEVAGELEPLGDSPAIRIVTGFKGWSGTITGTLVRTQTGTALDDVPSATWRDRLMRIKHGQLDADLVVGDIAVPVTVSDAAAPPSSIPRNARGDLIYDASFRVTERGVHDWEAYG